MKHAMSIFSVLKGHGLHPDAWTFNILLNGLCKAHRLNHALEFFSKADDYGVRLNISSSTIVIDGCFRCGNLEMATNLFD